MVRGIFSLSGLGFLAALALSGAIYGAHWDRVEAATTFQLLRGEWKGWGWVTLYNGGRERVRCRVSYESTGLRRLDQSLRCASTSYRIDAISSLLNSDGELSGSWRENSFDVAGTLSGRTRADGMSLRLTGVGFSADMSVKVAKCTQSVNMSVAGIEIRKVEIGLKRC